MGATVTVTPSKPTEVLSTSEGTDGQLPGHCLEAVELLAALEAELLENSVAQNLPPEDLLTWSAAERAVLEMVACSIDRKVDLAARYLGAENADVRRKLSGELRLLETNVARLLKQVNTDLPPAPVVSFTSQQASKASRTRWDRHNGAS